MDELDNKGTSALPYALAGGDEVHLNSAYTQYDVYVNGTFVGHKMVMNQVEEIDEVADYLQRNNYTGFSTKTNEQDFHYNISVADTDNASAFRGALTTYLNSGKQLKPNES